MACIQASSETTDDESKSPQVVELGFLQALVSSISDRANPDRSNLDNEQLDSVKVMLETMGHVSLGTLDHPLATQTVSDLKAFITNFLRDSGKVPTMLLYDHCPLEMESTLCEVFGGKHEVTIQVALIAATPACENDLQSDSCQSEQSNSTDQLWETVQKSALEQINDGSDGIHDLPCASSSAANRCLALKGYELPGYGVDVIGTGSYGRVFKAVRKGESSPMFAVKRQPLGKFDESSVPVFRETSILHALRGRPNIVKVVDVFLAVIKPDVPEIWAVLEFYEADLEAIFCCRLEFAMFYEGDVVMESMAKNVVFQMLLGVNELHKKDIVHRDLKPKNILLNLKPHLKVALCDFGMSRSVHGLLSNANDGDIMRRSSFTSNPCSPATTSGGTSAPPPRKTSDAMSDGADGTPFPQPLLKREFSTHIMTSNYRAPEMFGFADVNRMRKKHFKSLDTYSLGLIWAKLLVGCDVLEHSDKHHPSEFLLLENLKKIDCPTLDDVREGGFVDEAINFIELVRSEDVASILERWRTLTDPPDVQAFNSKHRRERVLEASATTIDVWIHDNRGEAGISRDALQLIRDATRFCYSQRLSAKDMLLHKYFDSERTHEIDFVLSKDHVEDVKIALGSHLSRISSVIERKRKCPKLSSPGNPPTLRRTVSEERTIVDMQAICSLLRAEIDKLQAQANE